MLLRSAASTEADLLRRHQLVSLSDVVEAGSDHPLGEFGDVTGQRDGSVAAGLLWVLPGLDDWDDPCPLP